MSRVLAAALSLASISCDSGGADPAPDVSAADSAPMDAGPLDAAPSDVPHVDGPAPDAAPVADGQTPDVATSDATGDRPDRSAPPVETGCPTGTELVGAVCVDRYEAPNRAGARPLVMYTFDESEAWCAARGRRLCFDDEWTAACRGPDDLDYPYGAAHERGVCRDDARWRAYDQGLLDGWPRVSTPEVDSLEELLAAASAAAPAAAEHVEWLYQGEPAGENPGCTNATGVFDTVGNVEEWSRRRDGGAPRFHGALRGRYWADPRSCRSRVLVHGDAFRFYEIGFRCCVPPRG